MFHSQDTDGIDCDEHARESVVENLLLQKVQIFALPCEKTRLDGIYYEHPDRRLSSTMIS